MSGYVRLSAAPFMPGMNRNDIETTLNPGRLGWLAQVPTKTELTVAGRRAWYETRPDGNYITSVEGWEAMSNLDKAVFQLQSPYVILAREGALWTGQCQPEVWGFEACEIARALVSPTTQTGSVYAAIASLIRYGQCWDSPAICDQARQQVGRWRAGAALLPAPSLGPVAAPIPAPLPAPTVPSTAPAVATGAGWRCPVTHPVASLDEYGQLLCAQTPAEAGQPVSTPYQYEEMEPGAPGFTELYTPSVEPEAEPGGWWTERTLWGQAPNWMIVGGLAAGGLLAARLLRR